MRCGWVKQNDELYIAYHDNEWGMPLHDEAALFELFCLETQVAGLSWLTVLKKRDGYRKAFEGFDIERVASYDDEKIESILASGLVIRSRPKLKAIVSNAALFLKIRKEFGSLDNYFWGKINHEPITNSIQNYKNAPTTSSISDEISKELKKRGFKFVGSVTVYAFMQACGMVNDHEDGCFLKMVI